VRRVGFVICRVVAGAGVVAVSPVGKPSGAEGRVVVTTTPELVVVADAALVVAAGRVVVTAGVTAGCAVVVDADGRVFFTALC
jgi:hypothetical protein